ncbi:MAG: undecaprenyl-diphosphate phosphatase [Turicibacter sp.]|nr:undecaprenyl-diphosphate phosphatase [Turicibacter sp.]
MDFDLLELLRVIFLSIVQGITEWLPVSSTGHMLLIEEFLEFSHSEEFWSVFVVVIQLASVMAVVTTFFKQLNPFKLKGGFEADIDKIHLWFKIIVASIPAGIVGIYFDDFIESYLGTPTIIAAMLIFYGIIFIVVENINSKKTDRVKTLPQINYRLAFMVGIFQMLAVIPGTSRSGATIIGGLLLGMSRKTAAEFTFFLAIPAMAGASLLRITRVGLDFTQAEWFTMIIGCITAFLVSVITIKFLLSFIKRNNFKPFAYYRILLGIAILAFFFFM